MDLVLLQETLAELGEPSFRAKQVWSWAARGATGYEDMTDLPAALRSELAARVPFSTLSVERESSSKDGTVKALFHTADGRAIEAVLMRYRDGRHSVCVSSQSGCPLTCTFCATGQMRFARNLTASEILDQALHFRRMSVVDHVIFMGMGEPMMNLDHVLEACSRLPDVGVTHRRTAISTVGWIPGIDRLTETEMPIRLALSLHAADEELRSQIMPVNDRYPLADVLDACERFYAAKRRQVFVEYVMLAGVNDSRKHAIQLAAVLDPKIYKVNLIPYNPTDSIYDGSERDAIAAFRDVLVSKGVRATIRLTRGQDIDAACGQLAAKIVLNRPTERPVATSQTQDLLVRPSARFTSRHREGRDEGPLVRNRRSRGSAVCCYSSSPSCGGCAGASGTPARASPARSRRSRSSAVSSGVGSHSATSGRSCREAMPNSFRKSDVVR